MTEHDPHSGDRADDVRRDRRDDRRIAADAIGDLRATELGEDATEGALAAIVRPLFRSSVDLYMTAEAHAALTDGADLIAAAESDADGVRDQARQEGLAQAAAQATELLAAAQRERDRMLEAARDDIAVLAVATARKVLDRALVDEALVIELVEQALDEAQAARHIKARIGPVSPPALSEARERLAEGRPDTRLEIEIDDELEPGDCVLDTDVGTVDARIDVQLEALLRALLDMKAT